MSLITPLGFVVSDANAFNAHSIRPRMRLRSSLRLGVVFVIPHSCVQQLVGAVRQPAGEELARLKLIQM